MGIYRTSRPRVNRWVGPHRSSCSSASHYPAKLASFVVSCGPGSRSERELVGWIVRVVANVGCQKPWLVTLAVSDGVTCTRHGYDDRVILYRDHKFANEVLLGHAAGGAKLK